MEQKSIPEWMTKEEQYEPKKDADGFMTKSMLQLMGVLAKARKKGGMASGRNHASFWLGVIIYLIILVSCGRNMYFHGCVLAGIGFVSFQKKVCCQYGKPLCQPHFFPG